jgi:hypothetical protein
MGRVSGKVPQTCPTLAPHQPRPGARVPLPCAGKVATLQASLAQEIKERDQLTSEFEGYYRDLIQRARRTPAWKPA